jgi:hypothetical protein
MHPTRTDRPLEYINCGAVSTNDTAGWRGYLLENLDAEALRESSSGCPAPLPRVASLEPALAEKSVDQAGQLRDVGEDSCRAVRRPHTGGPGLSPYANESAVVSHRAPGRAGILVGPPGPSSGRW